jgi:hypothetical protein
MSSSQSAFNWRNNQRPSIFVTDPVFTIGARMGKTLSHTSSEAVQRFTEKTGRNHGSIRGLSARGNLLIEESEQKRGKRA